MKKFIIVLLTISLLSCAICIGVSADEIVKGKDIVDSGSLRIGPPDYVEVSPDLSRTQYIGKSNSSGGGNASAFSAYTAENPLMTHRFYLADSGFNAYIDVTFSEDVPAYIEINNGATGDFNWVIDGVTYTIPRADTQKRIYVASFSPLSTAFRVRETVPPMFTGLVSTPVSFAAQVLNFITSTPFILVLVGLSIGLAIVPFAVVKLKELVKGY